MSAGADNGAGADRTEAAPELEFRVAIRDAIAEELERDPAVVFFGEDVAAEQGGVFAVTPGLQDAVRGWIGSSTRRSRSWRSRGRRSAPRRPGCDR